MARDLTFAEQAMAKELVLLMGVAAAREYRDVLKAAREQGRDGKAGLEQDLTRGPTSDEASYISCRLRAACVGRLRFHRNV